MKKGQIIEPATPTVFDAGHMPPFCPALSAVGPDSTGRPNLLALPCRAMTHGDPCLWFDKEEKTCSVLTIRKLREEVMQGLNEIAELRKAISDLSECIHNAPSTGDPN